MTTYFDSLEHEIATISAQTRGDDDAFLEKVSVIERTLTETSRLNSGDREFPHDIRQRVTAAIALRSIFGAVEDDHPDAPSRTTLALRRSQLVSELHGVFHDLAVRQI